MCQSGFLQPFLSENDAESEPEPEQLSPVWTDKQLAENIKLCPADIKDIWTETLGHSIQIWTTDHKVCPRMASVQGS